MMNGEPEAKERRVVEALAQALYEKKDPAGIAWAKRTRFIREAWVARASPAESCAAVLVNPAPAFQHKQRRLMVS